MIKGEADKIIGNDRKRISTAVTKMAGQIYLLKENGALLPTEMYKLRICLSHLQELHNSLTFKTPRIEIRKPTKMK